MSVSHWPPKNKDTKHPRKQHVCFIIQDKIIWRVVTRLLGESMVKWMAVDWVSHFLRASCLILKALANQRWAECVWLSEMPFYPLWPWPYVSTSLRCLVYKNKLGVVQQEVSLTSVTLERDPEQKKCPRNYTFETISAHPTCTLHMPQWLFSPMVTFGLDLPTSYWGVSLCPCRKAVDGSCEVVALLTVVSWFPCSLAEHGKQKAQELG